MQTYQRGFSLIEMILVITLTSIIGIWATSAWVQQAEDAASASMGVWLLTIKEGVDQMLTRQSDFLTGVVRADQRQRAYADPWMPTIRELIDAGHLTKSFPQRAPLPYDVSIRVLAPQGLCLTVGCKIEAFLFAIPRDRLHSSPDNIHRVGKILEMLPGRGASVTAWAPQRLRGVTLDLPNPPVDGMSALAVGSVVLRSFYDSTAYAGFLRQADQRDAELKGNLNVHGRISSGQLQVGAVANPGEACESQGLIAQSSTLGLLVCQGGIWQHGTKQEGGFFVMNRYRDCKNYDSWRLARSHPQTGGCTCPSGYRPQVVARFHFPYNFSEDEYTSFFCVPD